MDIVILNYNSYNDTKILVNSLLELSDLITNIFIVDNNSNNDREIENLNSLLKENSDITIDLIISEENLGYARGNNLGLKESLKKNSKGLVAVANPDITISREVLKNMKDNFNELTSKGIKVGLISPWVINKGTSGEVAWKLPNLFSDLIGSSFVLKKVIGNILSYKNLSQNSGLKQVDVLPGSFLVFNKVALDEIDFFPSETFLFCEERIIAKKLKDSSYLTYLDTDIIYHHEHSKTINKYLDISKKVNLLYDSKKIYYNNYVESKSATKILSILRFYTQFEIKVIYFLKRRVIK